MAIAVGVVGVGLAVLSTEETKRANRANERARKSQRRASEIANTRARRRSRAQARAQQALVAAEGEARGLGGSSIVAGQVSAIGSQAAEVLGFSGVQVAGANQVSQFRSGAAKAQGRAAEFQAIGGLVQQLGQGS